MYSVKAQYSARNNLSLPRQMLQRQSPFWYLKEHDHDAVRSSDGAICVGSQYMLKHTTCVLIRLVSGAEYA